LADFAIDIGFETRRQGHQDFWSQDTSKGIQHVVSLVALAERPLRASLLEHPLLLNKNMVLTFGKEATVLRLLAQRHDTVTNASARKDVSGVLT
jgi:hypothetical protein